MTDNRYNGNGPQDNRNDALNGTPDESFIQNILNRTSGSACNRACEQLPDLTDRQLSGLDRQLVQSHLEHCSGCRSVAVAMGWIGSLLPELAEVDPGPEFLNSVLAKTTQPVRESAETGFLVTIEPTEDSSWWWDKLNIWFDKVKLRPNFAAEFAYVATVILVLMATIPGAPLKGTPGKALQVVQAGPGQIPLVSNVVSTGTSWVDSCSSKLIDTVNNEVTTSWDSLEASYNNKKTRTEFARTEFGDRLRNAGANAKSGKIVQAGHEFVQAAKSGKQVWNLWWNKQKEDDKLLTGENNVRQR